MLGSQQRNRIRKNPCTLEQKSKPAWGDAGEEQAKATLFASRPLSPSLIPGGLSPLGWSPSSQSGGHFWESLCSLRKSSNTGKMEGRRLEIFFLDIFVLFLSFPYIGVFICLLSLGSCF